MHYTIAEAISEQLIELVKRALNGTLTRRDANVLDAIGLMA